MKLRMTRVNVFSKAGGASGGAVTNWAEWADGGEGGVRSVGAGAAAYKRVKERGVDMQLGGAGSPGALLATCRGNERWEALGPAVPRGWADFVGDSERIDDSPQSRVIRAPPCPLV